MFVHCYMTMYVNQCMSGGRVFVQCTVPFVPACMIPTYVCRACECVYVWRAQLQPRV